MLLSAAKCAHICVDGVRLPCLSTFHHYLDATVEAQETPAARTELNGGFPRVIFPYMCVSCIIHCVWVIMRNE